MDFIRHMRIAAFLRILCAVSLLMLTFAHQPFANAPTDVPDLAAYQLPDGSIPSICLANAFERDDEKGKTGSTQCEACRISHGVALPGPASSFEVRIARVQTRFERPGDSAVVQQDTFVKARPRGPPAGHQTV